MTPSQAAFHRLMLLAGLNSSLDAELDKMLEREDPLSWFTTALTVSHSNFNELIQVLGDYSACCDEEEVFALVLSWLREQYFEEKCSMVDFLKYTEALWRVTSDRNCAIWDSLSYPGTAWDCVVSYHAPEDRVRPYIEQWLTTGTWPGSVCPGLKAFPRGKAHANQEVTL